MKEKVNIGGDKKEIKRIYDEEKGYRLIGGVPERAERFTRLEKEVDYEFIKTNDKVRSEKSIEDFMLFVNPSGGKEEAVIKAPHWRTVTIPRVKTEVLRDKMVGDDFVEEHVPFYDLNIKGVGYLKPSVAGENRLDDYDSWITKIDHEHHDFGYKTYGIMSKAEYNFDSNLIVNTNYFLQHGLRTEVFWGAARLKRVVYRGRMVTIDELRKEGVILKRRDYTPVMGVRLLKTNDRIQEAAESDERRASIFKKAFDVFNQESEDSNLGFPKLDIKNPEHQRIYFEEFFKRMGGNMAVMLNIGYMHNTLHSANVTMAAEVADVGTMQNWKNDGDEKHTKIFGGLRRGHIKDMRDIAYGLKILLGAGQKLWMSTGDSRELLEGFMDGFDHKLDREDLKKDQATDPKGARDWMERIIKAVVVEGKNLPSLLRSEVTDWRI